MNRRVIFVPDDYWTNPPKENEMPIDPNAPGDLRRAGVFIKWRCYNSQDGCNSVLQEALDTGRVAQFVGSVLTTLSAVAAQLLTEHGQRALAEDIAFYAAADPEDFPHEWRRAARLIAGHGRADTNEIAAVLKEQNELTPTILSIVDVYCQLLPGLTTGIGMQILDNGIRTLSGMEVEGDR
ncbi:hypothetical protein [Mycolicibacterium litorale]|uniref:hypothetical protein n=1 Tax=Mycolicibacterium litorale TaxID=758802 RepID=UPI0039A2820A